MSQTSIRYNNVLHGVRANSKPFQRNLARNEIQFTKWLRARNNADSEEKKYPPYFALQYCHRRLDIAHFNCLPISKCQIQAVMPRRLPSTSSPTAKNPRKALMMGMKNPLKLLSMGKGKQIIDNARARRVGWRLPAPPVHVAQYQRDLALILNKDLSQTQTRKSVGDMMSTWNMMG